MFTVRTLIKELLDAPMDAKVWLYIEDEHEDEHGVCQGYTFDIESVEHKGCYLKFKDWRRKE